ncbi:MAG: TetR/AcrR family transcriptional regulator [Gaiellaceae bacterium]
MSEPSTTLGIPRVDSATPRERILEAAYELFSRHGLQAVGINSVVEHSGVAKRTLYRNFGSKDELIVEFLRMREERWTKDWLQRAVEARATDPEERLLAVFDVFHDWFQGDDLEGCSFINVLLEVDDRSSPVRQAAVEHLANIRRYLETLAAAAGIERPDDFARRWHILMKGSIVAAQEGDRDAAHRAQEVGRLLLGRARAGLLD